ncbi:MAG: hypothetical protein LUG60_06580 [Erysipelotrichaceae bacterium]|nr:hypothetical protein [Erysipelotrichaceae bacterium]
MYTRVFAGRLKDRKKLIESSSGGAFVALSDYFIEKGYAVVASIYDYDNNKLNFQLFLIKKIEIKRGGQSIFKVM